MDSSLFKNEEGQLAECKLIVKYLMSTENYEYLAIPESHQAKSLVRLKKEIVDSKYIGTPINELAVEIRVKMPPNTQNSVREIVKCYRNWIRENIWYPDLNFIKTLDDMNYTHINDPLRTLELKMGVCADDAQLLQALLETQGIASEYISGYASSAVSGDRSHAVLGIILDSGTYMVDPTVYRANEFKEIELEKDLVVSLTSERSEVNIYEDRTELGIDALVPLCKESSTYENPSFDTSEFTFKKVYIENFNFNH